MTLLRKFHKLLSFNMSLRGDSDLSTLPNGIYCLNYHRVGDMNETMFDANVFSCTEEALNNHIGYLKEHFTIISLDALLQMIEKPGTTQGKYLVITFDDGYIDNYTKAFPILKSHGVTASFFVATDYISSSKIPWWDSVAYIINSLHDNSSIKLASLSSKTFKLYNNKKNVIREILRIFKEKSEYSIDEKLAILKRDTGIDYDKINSGNLFMTWDMLKEMSDDGMDIGSHTCSHQLLSHLDSNEQTNELTRSKKIIERHIGKQVIALAYPVGAFNSYNLDSSLIAKLSGYKLAFDFEKGINTFPLKDRAFELHRFPVNYEHDNKAIITMFFNVNTKTNDLQYNSSFWWNTHKKGK